MNISCDIIKDILPLYAEDMVSKATKDMVEEHLCGCEGCAKELEGLRKPAKVPVEIATESLKRVGDSIRRRRILAVMAVFLFIATVIVGGALMLDAKIYLSANEAVEDILLEDDTVKIVWHDGIIGTLGNTYDFDDGNFTVTAWTNLQNILFPVQRVPYEMLDETYKSLVTEEQYAAFDNSSSYGYTEMNFWYVDINENSMHLLRNAEQPFPEGPMMDVEPYTGYYAAGFVFLGAVCFLFDMLNRNRWYGELAGRLAVLSVSLAISAVVVTAGRFTGLAGDFQEMLVDSSAVALPMTLFGLCLRQLIKLNRQDKGL